MAERKHAKDSAALAGGRKESLLEAQERHWAEAQQMTLFSNTFMSVTLEDPLACQYVLRILLGKRDLIVREVRTQYRISKLASHDAILDVLAEDSKGRLYNIEVQRADTVDHARRTRLYGAMIDSAYLEKGKDYARMPEVHIIYISETDLWKAGRCVYPVKKYFDGTDISYDDGIHVMYVNAAVNDGTDVAKLMEYFKTADPEDASRGDLSKRVHLLKREERGKEIMCEVTEKWLNEGELLKAKKTALNLADMGLTLEKIAKAVEVNVATVRKWLDGAAVTR